MTLLYEYLLDATIKVASLSVEEQDKLAADMMDSLSTGTMEGRRQAYELLIKAGYKKGDNNDGELLT